MPTSPNTPAPNVLQITPELDTGGVERTTVDMARGILAAGGKAFIATRGGRLQGECEAAGATVINLPVHSKNPFTILLNIVRLHRIVRKHGIDVIHVRSRAPAWSALPAARWTGKPLVTTYHGTYTAKSALKRFYNSGMARGDAVLANSAFIAARIRSEHRGLNPDPLIVYSGTDLNLFEVSNVAEERKQSLLQAWSLEDNDKPIILLPGRLTQWKGQRVLVEAAALLKAAGLEDFLVILAGDAQGRDNYEKELWDLIREQDLTTQVRLTGHCADMAAAYAISDIVVSASTEPEAFGRIAVEAQAMQRPIIASSHGGAEETVTDDPERRTGWRVRPGDADDLAKALKEALALSPQAAREIGKRGREHAKTFSVEVMIETTLRVYQNLMAPS